MEEACRLVVRHGVAYRFGLFPEPKSVRMQQVRRSREDRYRWESLQ
jgi:hypothetical protein